MIESDDARMAANSRGGPCQEAACQMAEQGMRNGQGLARLLFDAKGAVAVEFAVVSVFMSLLLIGLIDFGLGFWEQMLVGNAARAGAQWAMIQGINGYDSSTIATAVTSATGLSSITATPAPAEFCGCPSVSGGISNLSSGQCGTPPPTCPTSAGICVTGPSALGCPAATYVTVKAQASYATLFAYPGIASPITLNGTMTVRLN
jgi:Flp pilus assembly pilin Flp